MVKSKFFNMGQILITRGISETVGESECFAAEVVLALHRFAVKDWGDLDAEDIKANEEELNNPDDLYLLAAYKTQKAESGSSQIVFQRKPEIMQLQFFSHMRDREN